MYKKVKVTIDRLPNECLCKIIEYFNESRDFFSLTLTIRGLYQYVQNESPKCTKNITYVLRAGKIPDPSMSLKHVSSLETGGFYGEYLRQVFTQFPSLMKLRVVREETWESVNITHYNDEDYVRPVYKLNINDFQEGIVDNLAYLEIYSCDNKIVCEIEQIFPKLETLSLINGTSLDNEEEHDVFCVEPRIDFSKLNRLKHLCLVGCKVVQSLDPLKDQLEELVIGRTTISDFSRIYGFNKLRIIELSRFLSFHPFYLGDHNELPSLEKLKLENFNIQANMLEKWLYIQDFPYLKNLNFVIDRYEMYPENTKFYIRNLPKLEYFSFSVRNLEGDKSDRMEEYVFSNLPALKTLELCRHGEHGKIVVPSPSSDLPALENMYLHSKSSRLTWENNVGVFFKNLDTWKGVLKVLRLLFRKSKIQGSSEIPWVDIVDFPKLEELKILQGVVLRRLIDCPLLKILKIDPYVPELPKDEHNGKEQPFQEYEEKKQPYMPLKEIRGLESLTTMELRLGMGFKKACEVYLPPVNKFCRLELLILSVRAKYDIELDGLLFENIQHLYLSRCGSGSTRIVEKAVSTRKSCLKKVTVDVEAIIFGPPLGQVEVVGMSKLPEIETILFDGSSLAVKDCEELRKITIKSYGHRGVESVVLEDLPNLTSFCVMGLRGEGKVRNFSSEKNVNKACVMEMDLVSVVDE